MTPDLDTSNGPIVLGMGNPLLDISANVPQSFLDKYGLKLNDAILAADQHLPIYKELTNSFQVDYIAGGATQNAIRICQWMMQKPNATAYIGSVGDDEFGTILADRAQSEGVAVHYHIEKGVPTGTCAVLVHEHERSLVANLAAANCYKHEHLLQPEIEAVWSKAKIIYIAGFFLTVSPVSIIHLAKFAADNNRLFVMNLAAPFISEFFNGPLAEALPYCDIVIGNENESAAYAKAFDLKDKSPEGVATAIASLPSKSPHKNDRMVIITQGSHPTIVYQHGKVSTYPVPAVPQNELVDLNGAGDAFVGGLLAYLAEGKPLDKAIAAGHYCAGVVIRRSGCTVQGKPNFKA